MPRFVILEHDHPYLHWDFMLEAGGILRTWRLATPPQAGQVVKAQPSFDHRILYLDYEGPIDGNRGAVVKWDGGSFSWRHDSENHVQVYIKGEILKGQVDLVKGTDDQWQLTLVG